MINKDEKVNITCIVSPSQTQALCNDAQHKPARRSERLSNAYENAFGYSQLLDREIGPEQRVEPLGGTLLQNTLLYSTSLMSASAPGGRTNERKADVDVTADGREGEAERRREEEQLASRCPMRLSALSALSRAESFLMSCCVVECWKRVANARRLGGSTEYAVSGMGCITDADMRLETARHNGSRITISRYEYDSRSSRASLVRWEAVGGIGAFGKFASCGAAIIGMH